VLHDRGARGWRTAEALGHLLPALAARGYRVVTLSALVAEGHEQHAARADAPRTLAAS
jgi:hypothetical protein